jgi:hypothetical protein
MAQRQESEKMATLILVILIINVISCACTLATADDSVSDRLISLGGAVAGALAARWLYFSSGLF